MASASPDHACRARIGEDRIMMTGEDLLKDMERLSEERDESLVSAEWTGKGEEHGYAWPDIRVRLVLVIEDDGRLVHGMALPRGVMDDVKARVRFEKAAGMMAMNPPAPREDVVMALDAALERFGEPTCLALD
jgi:hypothetical protein